MASHLSPGKAAVTRHSLGAQLGDLLHGGRIPSLLICLLQSSAWRKGCPGQLGGQKRGQLIPAGENAHVTLEAFLDKIGKLETGTADSERKRRPWRFRRTILWVAGRPYK